MKKLKAFWEAVVIIWKNGDIRQRMDLLNLPLGIILFFTGFGIIIWQFGWWLALALFLLQWSQNIDNGIKFVRTQRSGNKFGGGNYY